MKKNNYQYFAFIIILISLNSCNSYDIKRNNIHYITSFPVTKEVKAYSANISKTDFYPMLMGLKDTVLLFCDSNNAPHFHAFSIPSVKYLGSFGKQGQGPSDIPDPVFWDQFENTKDIKFWVYQMNMLKFTLVDLKQCLNNTYLKPDKKTIMPPEANASVNILKIDSCTFVGSGIDAKGEFFIYDSNSKKIEWVPFINDFDNSYNKFLSKKDLLAEVKRGILKIRPDRKFFVKAYLYYPIIDIYNANRKLKFSIIYKKLNKPTINANNKETDKTTGAFYDNIYLTDNYIYAIYKGCTKEYYMDNKSFKIHVFNWKGNPVCEYIVNESIDPLSPFVVDEKTKTAYFTNSDYNSFLRIVNLKN